MKLLTELNPVPVWRYFSDICAIPRISGHEKEIRQYLLNFAAGNNLDSKEDNVGNILIIRPASPGMEKVKVLVLQSHLDMVGEKNADNPHNWYTDPIVPVVNGDWVTAAGTTLGADDGIGIATQLAILSDSELKAGRIECLFTVDEESGMTGAKSLDPDFFSGRILINLDSEDEGLLFIGCAGGLDTVGTLKYKSVPAAPGTASFEISVTGLHGGHSGDEIHKGYANSVKIMTRILRDLAKQVRFSLSTFNGGNLRNAIPREAFATIVAEKSDSGKIISFIESYYSAIKMEFGETEKELKITVIETDLPETVMDEFNHTNLINALTCCPHGVIAWSKELSGLVETSTNLASVKFTRHNEVKIVTTQRSSIESAKHDAGASVEACLRLAGAEVEHSSGYPGWRPDMNSEILRITSASYKKLFGNEPEITVIHAGLECGLINQKVKNIDMISFGPTIKGAHTPEEKIEIKTVQKFWDLLIHVIDNIPYA